MKERVTLVVVRWVFFINRWCLLLNLNRLKTNALIDKTLLSLKTSRYSLVDSPAQSIKGSRKEWICFMEIILVTNLVGYVRAVIDRRFQSLRHNWGLLKINF